MLHPYFTYQIALQRLAALHEDADNIRRSREAKSYRRARAGSVT